MFSSSICCDHGDLLARFNCGKVRAVVAATVAIALLIGMNPAMVGIVTAAPSVQRTLAIGMGEAVGTANPFLATGDNEYIFFGMIYDTLIGIGKDGEPMPNLAHNWWYMDGLTAAALQEPTDFSNPARFPVYSDPSQWPMGSIWEYNLTPNVFWNDGTPFTADDVVWTKNIQVGENFMIYWAFQPTTWWISHAEKVDDYKVRIFYANHDTKEPSAVAFGDNYLTPIMPKHIFKDKPPTYMGYDWEGFPAIGTGPFKGTDKLRGQILAGESITLLRNPYFDFEDSSGNRVGLGGYYDRTLDIDRIVLTFFTEEATLALAVKTGEIDAAKIGASNYLAWMNNPAALPKTVKLVSMLSPTLYSKQVSFNAFAGAPGYLSPLRLDPAVHRAAALATNKSFIIDSVYKGQGEIGYGLISPVWPEWYWDPENDDTLSEFSVVSGTGETVFSYAKPIKDAMEFDLELANDILDAAGYEWTGTPGQSVRKASKLVAERMHHLFGVDESVILGVGGTSPLELSFDMFILQDQFEDRQIADYLISEWIGAGIKIIKNLVSAVVWDDNVYSYTYNTMITYWSGDPDPNYLSFVPTSYALYGWNEFGVSNATYDQLYMRQAQELNHTERKHLVDEIQKWQYLSGSMITLAYPKICFAYNELRWTDWGDWLSHPGMTIDAFWGENPLFFELQWTGQDDTGMDILTISMAAGTVAAIAAAVAFLMHRIKKRRSLEEQEEED